MVQFSEQRFKSVLNKKKYIDSWFWDRYTLNPYRGCSFGCIYCDARSDHYQSPLDFENDIIIKSDIAAQLDSRISRARTLLPDVVGIGGVTDCYQPAEKKYENTRQVLAVLARHRYPAHIVTKSNLVTRDIDLLDEVTRQTWASVSFTITTLNEEKSKFLEVRSPNPAKRLAALQKLKSSSSNLQAGVLLIPLVPKITDSTHQMEELVKKSKDAGSDYLLFSGGMSMRNSQALWFLKQLTIAKPEVLPHYERLYKFSYDPETYRGSPAPDQSYYLTKEQQLAELCDKHQIPIRIKRFIPTDFRQTNYLVAEKLLNEAYTLQIAGKLHSDLFWAGQNIQNLSSSVQKLAANGQIDTIRNVKAGILAKVQGLLEGLKTDT